MLDHISIAVSDYARSKSFYKHALAPLGIALIMEVDTSAGASGQHGGLGSEGKPYFWIGAGGVPQTGVHVAFAAATRAKVREFYDAALAAGGRDNGPPGLRTHYHPHYFGAFVLDPDGHNIEAVCHTPED